MVFAQVLWEGTLFVDVVAEVFVGRLNNHHVAVFVDAGRDVEFIKVLADEFFVNCHNYSSFNVGGLWVVGGFVRGLHPRRQRKEPAALLT